MKLLGKQDHIKLFMFVFKREYFLYQCLYIYGDRELIHLLTLSKI